jgi:DNA-binding response OmpR family regulator
MGPILVVEDERDLAATCERLLGRLGWRVVTAGTREAALLALAAKPRPALAIVDRQLPDGDGLDVLRAAVATGMPVIMITGYGSAATRRLTLDEGAAGFLAKPFAARELLDLVRAIAGNGPGADDAPPLTPPPPRPPAPGIHC